MHLPESQTMTGKIAWFWATQYSPDCGQLSRATLFCLPCSCEPKKKNKVKALRFWLQYFCNILLLTFTQVFLLQAQSTLLTGVNTQLPEVAPGIRSSRNYTWLSNTGFSVEAETMYSSSALDFQSTLLFSFATKMFQRENNSCTCFLNQGPITLSKRWQSL